MTQTHSPVDILVAHESWTTGYMMAERLEAVGYRVANVCALEKGFDALYGLKPQLVVINARMPDRAALKLALAAKARGAKLLVIDDKAKPHETSFSIRAFTDAQFLPRRRARGSMEEAAAALIGPAAA